ncbi:MAG: FkbM family methyltransferase [Ruminococcus sp.]|nr:FkbM family methyltransferase [Ruminococcus sp.]
MFSLERFLELESSWEFLRKTELPIFIYGMGDGCVKLLNQFEKYGIKESGIFASDEFVRGHSFMGHTVKKLSQVEEKNEEFVVVLAFGAGYDSLIEKIDSISRKHKLIVPDTAVIGGEPFTKEYLEENFERAEKVYELMADEFSKKVYENIICYKITGEISYLREITTLPCEAYENLLGNEFSGTYVDLGAYNGDTVREFIEFSKGNHKEIIAVEPNGRNFRKLCEYGDNIKELQCVNAACWSYSGEINFSKGGGRMAKADEKGVVTKCVSVDDLVGNVGCAYIKYDVEGAEKEALDGSAETIKRFSPKLCVALYHRLSDMIDIPLQVYEMNKDYKFYIRHYPYYPAWETNLFCI